MAKKYKMVRVPEDVFDDWIKRKNKIQSRVKLISNKPPKITLTNVLRYYGKKKVAVWDDELINFFKDGDKKRKFTGDLI